MVTYGMLLLIRVKHMLNAKPGGQHIVTYPEVGKAVFGPWGEFIVDF